MYMCIYVYCDMQPLCCEGQAPTKRLCTQNLRLLGLWVVPVSHAVCSVPPQATPARCLAQQKD